MKKPALFALILALALTCAACGADDGAQSPDASPGAGDAVNTPDAPPSGQRIMPSLTPEQEAEREAFQQIMERQPDVQGVVSKVVGNEVTLLLIDPIEMPRFTVGEGGPGRGEGEFTPPSGAEIYRGEGEDGSFQIVIPSGAELPTGGFDGLPPGEGQDGMFIQGGPAMSIAGDAEIEVTYTGDESTLTLPAALSIRSGRTTVDPSGLKKDQILSLWYGENEEVVYAMLMGNAADTP